MDHDNNLQHVATFCGQCSCGCPQLWLDPNAPAHRRVVITDDFGQRIQLSVDQLSDLVSDIKGGAVDGVLNNSC